MSDVASEDECLCREFCNTCDEYGYLGLASRTLAEVCRVCGQCRPNLAPPEPLPPAGLACNETVMVITPY